MTIFYQIQDDFIAGGDIFLGGFGVGLDDFFSIAEGRVLTDGVQLFENILGASVATSDMRWAGLVHELIHLKPQQGSQAIYSGSLRAALTIGGAIQLSQQLSLHEGMTIAATTLVAAGWLLQQRMSIRADVATTAAYGATLDDAIHAIAALNDFFGADLTDAVSIALTQNVTYSGVVDMDDAVAIGASLSRQMLFNVTGDDALTMTDTDVLSMIYSGAMSDEMSISALYVAPDNSFTTWAINTRTNAITEYQNYVFNSFAQMGLEFVAASNAGLYKLNAPSDTGATNIQSVMQSGFFSPGDSKFTSIRNIYLGMRTSDNSKEFLLTIISGDGRTYTYAFQPNNQMTTKINTGKGLRSRYFAWKLVVPGPEFDLDGIEFLPMISQRRV